MNKQTSNQSPAGISTKFDESYFNDIWGTVHRHEYCEDLAARLIKDHQPDSVLDVGTGCGYLVKVLRDKGIDAWGLEVSDYALENSCAPEFVRKGDVRDIPFGKKFDLVHSQGLWGYFPEEDVQQAWSECNRVGYAQEHNVDSLDDDPTHQYVLIKDHEWWKNQFYPKVLVACPNHEVKEYAFQQWIDNVKSLTYPNYEIYVNDNSPNDDFMNRWSDQISIERINTTGIEDLTVMRINMSYEAIRKKFLAGDYDRLMIIESDIITPTDIIELLKELGGDTDWISHAYPMRGDVVDAQQGIGCSLFSRRLMEKYNFEDFADNYTSDGGLWMKVRPDRELTTMELWNYFKNVHLQEPRG